jgi:hypothetical protein
MWSTRTICSAASLAPITTFRCCQQTQQWRDLEEVTFNDAQFPRISYLAINQICISRILNGNTQSIRTVSLIMHAP